MGLDDLDAKLRDSLVEGILQQIQEAAPSDGSEWGSSVAELVPKAVSLCRLYGCHNDAESLLGKNFDSREDILGPYHPDTLEAASALADFLQQRGDNCEEVLDLTERASKKGNELFGPNDRRTLRYHQQYALALLSSGKLDEAEALVCTVYSVLSDGVFTDDNVSPENAVAPNASEADEGMLVMKRCLSIKARLLQARGDLEAASALMRDVEAFFVGFFGPVHYETRSYSSSLASMLHGMGRFDDAADIYARMVEQCRRLLRVEHIDVLGYEYRLSFVLLDLGNVNPAGEGPDALLYMTDVLLRLARHHGRDHTLTEQMLSKVTSLLTSQGRDKDLEGLMEDLDPIRLHTSVMNASLFNWRS